jgi:hypothetical protein
MNQGWMKVFARSLCQNRRRYLNDCSGDYAESCAIHADSCLILLQEYGDQSHCLASRIAWRPHGCPFSSREVEIHSIAYYMNGRISQT